MYHSGDLIRVIFEKIAPGHRLWVTGLQHFHTIAVHLPYNVQRNGCYQPFEDQSSRPNAVETADKDDLLI